MTLKEKRAKRAAYARMYRSKYPERTQASNKRSSIRNGKRYRLAQKKRRRTDPIYYAKCKRAWKKYTDTLRKSLMKPEKWKKRLTNQKISRRKQMSNPKIRAHRNLKHRVWARKTENYKKKSRNMTNNYIRSFLVISAKERGIILSPSDIPVKLIPLKRKQLWGTRRIRKLEST